jgi:hypothetical protein
VGAGKKALYLLLTVGGIIGLCVAFYVEFTPAGAPADQAAATVATPAPTPRRPLADGSAPPEPVKYLGFTMEQYLDKLDSFGDHLQEQGDFAKSVVHQRVDWRCKVYSCDTSSLVKSVLLVSAASAGAKYRVSAFFSKPDPELINRLRLLQRNDIVRVTGGINEDNIRVIDADDLVLSN